MNELEKMELIEDILGKKKELGYGKNFLENKTYNDKVEKNNKILLKTFEKLENDFRLYELIEVGEETYQLSYFTKKYWYSLNTKDREEMSYDYFVKKIKEYLVTFYELIKPETLIENKKIEFWTLKQENYRELDLKIKYRDKEQALKIRNNLPNKIKERIEKHNSIIIDLETELKSSKTKAERKETIKNNIEMYEKAISELQDELRRYIVLKEIYPIFQNYIFQNYNEIDLEVENEK